jgi:hypothetical protein
MQSKLAAVDYYGIAKGSVRQHAERETLNSAPADRLAHLGGISADPPKILKPRASGSAQRPVESVDPCTKNANARTVRISHLGCLSRARIALANDARRPY